MSRKIAFPFTSPLSLSSRPTACEAPAMDLPVMVHCAYDGRMVESVSSRDSCVHPFLHRWFPRSSSYVTHYDVWRDRKALRVPVRDYHRSALTYGCASRHCNLLTGSPLLTDFRNLEDPTDTSFDPHPTNYPVVELEYPAEDAKERCGWHIVSARSPSIY